MNFQQSKIICELFLLKAPHKSGTDGITNHPLTVSYLYHHGIRLSNLTCGPLSYPWVKEAMGTPAIDQGNNWFIGYCPTHFHGIVT